MQPSRQLHIYPNARSIRYALKKKIKTDQILPKLTTIGEFEKKIVRVKNRIFIDEDTRVLLLREASRFEDFKALKIDREFLSFLKNSSFILSFFDELSIEKVSLDDLESADYYASYQEHIAVLRQLRSNYIKLLESYGYCDKVVLPNLYQINHSYIKDYDLILLHLEGYLSKFELDLFEELSKNKRVEIELKTNRFNQKMIDEFNKLGFDLSLGYLYRINLSEREIVSAKSLEKTDTKFSTFSSNSRVLQVAFVKKSVYDLLKKGVDPSQIALITPDSSFVKYLMLFDDENLFNFAMGMPFVDSKIYKKLEAIYLYLIEQSIQNSFRLRRVGVEFKDRTEFLKNFGKFDRFEDFEAKILEFVDLGSDEYSSVFLKELHLFAKLFEPLKHREFRQILHLFLERLKKTSVDDVKGGKITVLEPLESRGVAYEGVIVVDFNDSIVPNRSQKDLFLSSDLRKICSMPTSQDRQNLQKYLYSSLFEKAKYVNISYVVDEQNMPSRFLDELEIKSESQDEGLIEKLHSIMFENYTQKDHFLKENLELEYDFTKVVLSASSLKTFLECKRRYYYRYIAKLQDATIPTQKKDKRDIGIKLHSILNEFYKEQDSIKDKDDLLLYLQKKLYQESNNDISFRFQVDLWLERLKKFSDNEYERFEKGFRVYKTEEEIRSNLGDFKIAGKIDRIDIKENNLYVIDYKSGKIDLRNSINSEKISDFQLQFYYHLSSQIGSVDGCYFYDLQNGKLLSDPAFWQKLEILEEKLDLLKPKVHNFTLCEDISSCKFCPYAMICDRDG
jgi:inactivated superfamily I helicase